MLLKLKPNQPLSDVSGRGDRNRSRMFRGSQCVSSCPDVWARPRALGRDTATRVPPGDQAGCLSGRGTARAVRDIILAVETRTPSASRLQNRWPETHPPHQPTSHQQQAYFLLFRRQASSAETRREPKTLGSWGLSRSRIGTDPRSGRSKFSHVPSRPVVAHPGAKTATPTRIKTRHPRQ